jgi:cell division protease FtsH
MAMWAVFLVLGVLFFQMYQTQKMSVIHDFNYKKFVEAVKSGKVESVTFRKDSSEIHGKLKKEFVSEYQGADSFQIIGDTGDAGREFVEKNGLTPNYERDDSSAMTSIFLNWLPLILLILMFMFLFRQLQAGGGKAMADRKFKAHF